jgi:hypothetical protein
MKELRTGRLQLGLFLVASLAIGMPAQDAGAFTLELEGSGGTTITINDNGPGDGEPAVGSITFNGSIDNFVAVTVIGLSNRIPGDPSAARIDLTGVSVTGGSGGTLTISLTDIDFDFTGEETLTAEIGGTTDGTTNFQGFLDTTNAAFGTSGAPVCTPGPQGPLGPGAFDDTATSPCTPSGPFSLTAVAEATIGANSVQSFGSNVRIPAPPPTPEIALLKQVSLTGGEPFFDADTPATAPTGPLGADATYRLRDPDQRGHHRRHPRPGQRAGAGRPACSERGAGDHLG